MLGVLNAVTRQQSGLHRMGCTTEAPWLGFELRRLDGRPVQSRPFGAEIHLANLFSPQYSGENRDTAEHLLRHHIAGKRALVIPAYATNAFFFAHLGASDVVGADADEAALAWASLIRDYYYTRGIGERYLGLLEHGGAQAAATFEQTLLEIVSSSQDPAPHPRISFAAAKLGDLHGAPLPHILTMQPFDFAYVPFLLGVGAGICGPDSIQLAYQQLANLMKQGGLLMLTPFPPCSTSVTAPLEANFGEINALAHLIPPKTFKVRKVLYFGDCGVGLLERC